MFKKLAVAAAVTASLCGGVQAASTTVSNGTLIANIGDNGTFDVSGGAGTPGLSWDGTEFLNWGSPTSWFVFNADGVDNASQSSPSTFAFPGSATYAAGAAAATTVVIGGWSFSQVTSAVSGNKLAVTLNITNNTGSNVTSGAFSVGFDPDQDIPGFGTFTTKNTIEATGGASAVSALGLGSGKMVTLQNDTSASAFNIFPYINAGNCCGTVSPVGPAFQGLGFTTTADDSINLIYGLGPIQKGQTVSIGYSYVFVPEPETYALLLAGLGVVGFIAKRRKMS